MKSNFQFEIYPESNGENGLWISKAVGGLLCLGKLKDGEFAFKFLATGITPLKARIIAKKLIEWADLKEKENE